MSANVWIATAIFFASVVAIFAYLFWYGWREESYAFTADEPGRPLPGALGASMEARLAEVFPPWEPPSDTPIFDEVKRQQDVRFMAEAIEELRELGVDLVDGDAS